MVEILYRKFEQLAALFLLLQQPLPALLLFHQFGRQHHQFLWYRLLWRHVLKYQPAQHLFQKLLFRFPARQLPHHAQPRRHLP
jgi:hypothetical protein